MNSETRPRFTVQLLHALLAPWQSMFRPMPAAARLQSMGWFAWILSALLHAAIWAGVCISIIVYEKTTYYEYIYGDPYVDPATGQSYPMVERTELRTRTFAEAWEVWGSGLPRLMPVLIFANFLLVIAIAMAALGLAILPYHYRSGSMFTAWVRGSRWVLSMGGWVIVLTAAVAGAVVAWTKFQQGPNWAPNFPYILPLIPGALCTLAWAWSRLERAIYRSSPAESVPPLCEGCGYDLTAAPLEGRCPECGLDIVRSLQDHQRSLASPPTGTAPDVWRMQLAWQVLTHPHGFYRGLAVRSAFDLSRRLQAFQLLCVGLSAAAWVTCTVLFLALDWEWEALIFPLFVGLIAMAAGWAIHRLVSGLVSAFAFGRRTTPYPPVVAIVSGFESAYLWIYCAYNGAWITSIFIFEDWLFNSTVRQLSQMIFRLPPEAVMVFIGNGLLTLFWLWRYAKVIKAVRWSNV